MKLLAVWLLIFAAVSRAAVLGIDYGSQFTKSCLVAPGVSFEMVLTADSKRKDLSGITFKKSPDQGGIERFYGNSAASLVARFSSQSPFYYKSLLGQSLEEGSKLPEYYNDLAPGMKLVADNRSMAAFDIFEETYPVEEVLAMSISDIKDRGNAMIPANYNDKINGITVTVPPFFSISQRQAILDAADLAGLEVISLIDSGSAVLTDFVSKKPIKEGETSYFLVYDCGASSTIATLAAVTPGASGDIAVDVQGIGYDEGFGGQYFTSIIKNILLEKLLEQNSNIKKKDVLASSSTLRKLWNEAERIKLILSANADTKFRIESVYDEVTLAGGLSRNEFQSALSNDLSRVKNPIEVALGRELIGAPPLKWEQLEGIIYMGGSTRVPFVKKEIEETYKGKVLKSVNTDESAVIGATYEGVSISRLIKSKKQIDTVARTIHKYEAVITAEGAEQQIQQLFKKGSPLNTKETIVLRPEVLEDFQITVTENGIPIQKYDFAQVKKLVKEYKPELFNYLTIKITFELTRSGTINLHTTLLEAKPIVTETTEPSTESTNTSTAETSLESENVEAESSESSAPKTVVKDSKPSPLVRRLYSKAKNVGAKPLGSSKNFYRQRLRVLKNMEIERNQRDHIRNTLEATLYRVKELSEDDAVLEKATEALDWLDYDSSSATTEELAKHLEDAQTLLSSIEKQEASSDASDKETKENEDNLQDEL